MSTTFTIEPQSYYQLYQKVKQDLCHLLSQVGTEEVSTEVTEQANAETTENQSHALPMSLELYTECICNMLFNTKAKTHTQFESNTNTTEAMLTDLRENIFILDNKANYPFQTAISPIIMNDESNEPQYMYMLGLLLDESYFELFIANLFLKTQNPYNALVNTLRYIKEELRILSHVNSSFTHQTSTTVMEFSGGIEKSPDTLNSMKQDLIKKYLNTARLIEKYDYKKLFPKTVPERYTRLIELKELKNKAKWATLINPFELDAHNYMIYSPPVLSQETHISCDSITCVKKPTYGSKVTSNRETFTKRMNEFCYNLLENSPNKKLPLDEKFPFENVIFAGGSVTHLIESEMNAMPNSDLDIFVYGDTYNQCLEAFNRIITWFDTPTTYYAIKGESVVNIYLKDVSRIFQIINTNAKHPYDVISHFDTSNVCWLAFYFDKKVHYPNVFHNELVFTPKSTEAKNRVEVLYEAIEDEKNKKQQKPQMSRSVKLTKIHNLISKSWNVFGTADSIESIRTRVARPIEMKKSNMERLMKTLYKGYHLEKTPQLLNSFDICNVVSNPNDVKGYIFEFNTHFYIKSSDTSDYADEDKKNRYIEGMISKFAKTDNVTNSPEYVMKKTTIYVNFANDYNSISFTNFSITQLRHSRQPLPRDLDRGLMMRRLGGPLNVMSSFMKVLQIIYGENKIEIELELTKEFREFINVVENNGIALYAKEGKIQSIITEKNSIIVIVDNDIVEGKQKNGVFILRNDRGEQLNIYEDLVCDDIVKMLFRINVFKRDNTRSIKFEVMKFIKQVPENQPIILERFSASEPAPKRVSFLQNLIDNKTDTTQQYKDLPL